MNVLREERRALLLPSLGLVHVVIGNMGVPSERRTDVVIRVRRALFDVFSGALYKIFMAIAIQLSFMQRALLWIGVKRVFTVVATKTGFSTRLVFPAHPPVPGFFWASHVTQYQLLPPLLLYLQAVT
jgi:hypothetical protein